MKEKDDNDDINNEKDNEDDINEEKNNNNNINIDINVLIQELTKKFTIEEMSELSFKKLVSKNNYYCSIRYYKSTILNPYENDICFSISIEDKSPYKILSIKCLTAFCFPNLCDNRNLYKAILKLKSKVEEKEEKEIILKENNNENSNENNNDNENKIIINEKENNNKINNIKDDKDNKNIDNENIFSLENIINLIPNFIKEIWESEQNKHLYKIGEGEYNIDDIYEVNDFLILRNNKFFRLKQIIDNVEYNRYIIITDIYFILIEPLEEFKNKIILLFFGYLHKLEREDTDNPNIINLNWSKNKNKENITIQLKIEDINTKIKLFDIIEKKVKLLIKQYKTDK